MNEVEKTFDEVVFRDDSDDYMPVLARHGVRETFPKHLSAADLRKLKRSRRFRAFCESEIPFLASSVMVLVSMSIALIAGVLLMMAGF